MAAQVAFLRAINVGARRVSMDRLRAAFDDLGFDGVSTFIASGNVLFTGDGTAPDLEKRIEAALAAALGFEVATFVRRASQIGRIVAGHPFGKSVGDQVHVGFLKRRLDGSARTAIERLSNETDEVAAAGREVYWLARGGMGRATISGAALEKALGQPTTLRSLKMLSRLQEKLR
ncbi:MAG: DUF1697 domain-containing protein [Actinomycetota bacterium]